MCYSPVHIPTERDKYDFWFCTQVSLLGKFLGGIYIHGFDRLSGFDRSTSADCYITDQVVALSIELDPFLATPEVGGPKVRQEKGLAQVTAEAKSIADGHAHYTHQKYI